VDAFAVLAFIGMLVLGIYWNCEGQQKYEQKYKTYQESLK
jgi:hypothetical protein